MNIARTLVFVCLLALLCAPAGAQQPVSLDSCRQMALRSNKALCAARRQVHVAELERDIARTKRLPRVSVAGGYVRSGDRLSLLGDAQKDAMTGLGTTAQQQLAAFLAANPELAQALNAHTDLLQGMDQTLNSVGRSLVDALDTDTRNVAAGAITLTQPLYMGGKIAALNRLRDHALDAVRHRLDIDEQQTVVDVDQAYWNLATLQARRRLAEAYLRLVSKLDNDVAQMCNEGFATRADALSVRVKVNEARVTLLQVDNGLEISRMALCRLCGVPLDTQLTPADTLGIDTPIDPAPTTAIDDAMRLRPELKALGSAVSIAGEQERIALADYLPHVALVGSYMAGTPSLYNGFEHKFKGDWHLGVTVQVPLFTGGERSRTLAAARERTVIARLQLDEAREQIELQVNRCLQLCHEADRRLEVAHQSLTEADENLRCATAGMSEGVIAVSDVLAAQTAWLSARSTLVAARADRILARLHLDRAMGRLYMGQ